MGIAELARPLAERRSRRLAGAAAPVLPAMARAESTSPAVSGRGASDS